MILASVRADIGQGVMLLGAVLIMISAIGVVRLPDALTRMHALSKASTLGVSLALIGAALAMTRLDDVMSLAFAAALQTFTNPVASTLLTRATYYATGSDPDADSAGGASGDRLAVAGHVDQPGDDQQEHQHRSDEGHDRSDASDAADR